MFTQRERLDGCSRKSPDQWFVFLEERLFVLDQHLHHLPLVADVVERCGGVQVGRSHQGGAEDDGQVLCVHQVELFVLCYPVGRRES